MRLVLRRIADPLAAELFGVSGNWGDRRARLTYFWWVVFGGKRLGTVEFEAVLARVHTRFSPDVLEEWMNLFRHVAVPVIGDELTRAWVRKAE
jgi:hypothetical protein